MPSRGHPARDRSSSTFSTAPRGLPPGSTPARQASVWELVIDRIVVAGLGVLGCLLVWRAATQAVTYDEAFTWLAFVRGSFRDVFTGYSANNHVLFSAAAWVSTHALGVSETTLRLPTLVGACAYLVIARALARTVAGRGLLFAIATGALVLNPFVLDYLVAARGYGIATAALLFAMLQLLRLEGDGSSVTHRRLISMGLALGISVSANLAFAFPAVGVGLTALLVGTFVERPFGRRGLLLSVARIALPMLLVCVPVLVVPLAHATREDMFYGAATLGETSVSLVAASLQYDTLDRWHVRDGLMRPIALVVVPAAVGFWMTAAAAIALRRRQQPPWTGSNQQAQSLLCVGSVFALTLGTLSLTHVVTGLPLPLERTGLYWLPLFVLGLAASAQALSARELRHRVARVAIEVTLAVLVAAYLAQFTTTHFRTWRFDAGSRDILDRVASWPCPAGRLRRLTTTSWLYEPALEFYRVVRHAEHVRRIDIDHETLVPGDADFYVLATADEVARVSGFATEVFRHPVSGAHLLVDHDVARCNAPAPATSVAGPGFLGVAHFR